MRSDARTLLFAAVLIGAGWTGPARGQSTIDEPLDPWRGAETDPDPLPPRELPQGEVVEPWNVSSPTHRPDAFPATEAGEPVDPWRGAALQHRAGELADPWADEVAPRPEPGSDPPTASFPIVDFSDGFEPEEEGGSKQPSSTSRAAFPLLE